MDNLNLYGDQLIETTGVHGGDISSQRIDNLDLACLNYALSHSKEQKTGIDIGCGSGIQSLRLALLGIKMHLYDLMDISERIKKIKQIVPLSDEAITFYHQNISNENFINKPCFDIVYSQRFIHYLHYDEACLLVQRLYNHTNRDGMVFISASGITSELGENYPGKGIAIQNRFCNLSLAMQEKHSIKQPVCLYHKDELCHLFTRCGFKEIEVTLSDFGNIKAIFKK